VRCLFVSPCTPRPHGTGWEQRSFSFLHAYAQLAEVEAWVVPSVDAPELEGLAEARALARSVRPIDFRDFGDPRWFAELQSAAAGVDLVHVTRTDVLRRAKLRRAWWDLDELPWIRGNVSQARRDQVRHELEANAQHAERVFVSSRRELDPGFPHMSVVPNVVHGIAADAGRYPSAEPPVLLFAGNFNYPPNIDAVAWLVSQAWPAIRGARSDVRLLLVGRSPRGDAERACGPWLAPREGVEVHLDVPRMEPFYERATASLAPIRYGGGTRIKIIESFAQRCPVISTTFGCAGLGVTDNVHLLIADSADAFARACLRLLDERELRRRLVDTAFAHHAAHHTQALVDRLIATALR
jgi:glycosyltransferase involved in cell wall biosynthesis